MKITNTEKKRVPRSFLDILIKIKMLASNVVVVTREREGRLGLGNFCMDP